MAISTPLTPVNPSNLKGLAVLITGGASGLGRHAATFFARSGALVSIVDKQDGSQIAKDLTNEGHAVQFIQCDVTDWHSQVKAFQAALSFSPTKTLDMVAAFAGIDDSGHLVDYIAETEASLDGPPPPAPSLAAIDVNLNGAYYTTALALHYFRLSPQGVPPGSALSTKSLAIVSSTGGYIDYTPSTSYAASKYGSRGIFRAVRTQAREQLNVRVNVIAPWAMRTAMTEKVLARAAEMGVVHGHGVTLVDHDVLTQALARITVDEEISGRAFGIMPEGAIDLGDDIEGNYAGTQLVELMSLRKQAGDFLHS